MTGRLRLCPVNATCVPLRGWEAFLAHVHDEHTSGTEAERQLTLQRLLEKPPSSAVVPKVTYSPETYALWVLARHDRVRAREIVLSMDGPERADFEEHLTELLNMSQGAS